MTHLAANIEAIQARIATAAHRAGRNPDEVTLVAVTKTYPVETVIAAYRAGLSHFGENRVPEGQQKVTDLTAWLTNESEQVESKSPTWHLIGHLQSRQVGLALGKFKLIHSVDSLKLAQRINRLAEREGHPPQEILLQCNVSGEAAKSGFALYNWSTEKKRLATFLEAVSHIQLLNKVTIRGLMTMAPFFPDPEQARPTYQSLAALRQTLQAERPQVDWQHLSMGMTNSFEVAIEEGASLVRVGRALFGARPI